MIIFVDWKGQIFSTSQENFKCITCRRNEISLAIEDFSGILDEVTGKVKIVIYTLEFKSEQQAKACFRAYYKACAEGRKAFYFSDSSIDIEN